MHTSNPSQGPLLLKKILICYFGYYKKKKLKKEPYEIGVYNKGLS